MNINTKEYWEERFATGHWESRDGRNQTRGFAKAQIHYIKRALPGWRGGSLLDFGCGTGDAFPLYLDAFRGANLIGSDISSAAIEKCRRDYGTIANFIVGIEKDIPSVDLIVVSNVLEHLTDYESVARTLVAKCADLFITVPFREYIPDGPKHEHVNRFDENSFQGLNVIERNAFECPGWSEYGVDLWKNVYLKNLLRPIFFKPIRRRRLQIIYHIRGARAGMKV